MRLRLLFPAAAVLAVMFVAGPASADLQFEAVLSGAAENPPNASTGTGTGAFTLNAAETNLSVSVSFSGLSAPQTAGHIHGPAAPGVNAGVVFGFPNLGAVNTNWAIPANHVLNLKAGLLYVNIHTQTFPGGELRGQIVASTPTKPSSWGRVKSLYATGGGGTP